MEPYLPLKINQLNWHGVPRVGAGGKWWGSCVVLTKPGALGGTQSSVHLGEMLHGDIARELCQGEMRVPEPGTVLPLIHV